jgi:2-iminobutanoate/2-iminopropanoate deaminase
MRTISTDKAPQAIGPYSQAVATLPLREILFLSGQLGLDPQSGALADGGVEGQAKQALANIEAILSAAGMSKENVVKTTIFLADLGDFQKVNAIYEDFFGPHKPARSTVQVSGLPRAALIEIECIAV